MGINGGGARLMYCSNCGESLEKEDLFCSGCGKRVEQQEVDQSKIEIASAVTMEDGQEEKKHLNENVEKAKKAAKNYWGFLLENIKSPFERGINQKPNDFLFGYFNIFFLSLFFGLGTYFEMKSITGGFSLLGNNIHFFKTFFSVFLYGIITSLVVVAVLFGIQKLLFKVSISFNHILARFGTLITIPTVLSVLFFIAALPGLIKIIGIIISLILISLQIAIIITFLSYRKQSKVKFDPIYGLLIAYVIMGIFVALTSDVFTKNFFSGLFNIF